jgi:preprotein translocase subunit YajC
MDPLLLVMIAVLALFVFFQFRSSKKRRAEQEQLSSKMVPGAEIMTQFGVYGTLLSIDEDKNEALVETTPGTVLRVHRQTILKVVEDEPIDEAELGTDEDAADAVIEPRDDSTGPDNRPGGKSDI